MSETKEKSLGIYPRLKRWLPDLNRRWRCCRPGPYHLAKSPHIFLNKKNSPSRTRTYDTSVNSRMLYRLSYWGLFMSNRWTHGELRNSPNALPTELLRIIYVKSMNLRRTKELAECSTDWAFVDCFFWKYFLYLQNFIQYLRNSFFLWLSPRSISNSQLHMLPCFHLCPIYLVVFKGSYSCWREISSWGGLHA